MTTSFFQEYESVNSYRNYPFSDSSVLVDTAGNAIPADFITDAILYPESGTCSLTSIAYDADNSVVVVNAGDLSGSFAENASKVDLFDRLGFHRGTLVLGNGAKSFFENATSHEYSGISFSDLCTFPTYSAGVTSVNFDGTALRGDISITGTGETARVRTVTNADDNSVRFDVIPVNKGLGGTGINTLYVVRRPGSLFNVLDRDGEPYLFLTSTGYMDSESLIDRDAICARSDSGSSAIEDLKEKSSIINCGTVPGSTPVPTGIPAVTNGEVVFPGNRGTVYRHVCDTKSPWTEKSLPSPFTVYGFSWTGSDRLGGGTSSMCSMNIEREIYLKFYAPMNGLLMAEVTFYDTYSASALFSELENKERGVPDPATGRGLGYLRGLDTSPTFNGWIELKADCHREVYEYFYLRRNGGLGFIGWDQFVKICHQNGWANRSEPVLDKDGTISPGQFNGPPGDNPEDLGIDRSKYPGYLYIDRMNEILKCRLKKDGMLASRKLIYVVRARDFFEHFKCKNWEVSSNVGDDVRMLVGFESKNGGYFTGGDRPFTFNGGDGEKHTYTTTGISRLVWWKKYSKRGKEVRHFIVPEGRGITIYTGDFLARDYRDYNSDVGCIPLKDFDKAPYWNLPELYMHSWTCAIADILLRSNSQGYVSQGYTLAENIMFYDSILRKNMFQTYNENFDPTYGYKREVFTDDVINSLAVSMAGLGNRVNDDTLVQQPVDSPVYRDTESDKHLYSGKPVGKFKYDDYPITLPAWPDYEDCSKEPEEPDEYGGDEPDPDDPDPDEPDPDTTEREILSDDIVLKFDMTTDRRNMISFDTTDLVSEDLVYSNPIHITPLPLTSVPSDIDISDPTDYSEVSKKMSNFLKKKTDGAGIEISIPGT